MLRSFLARVDGLSISFAQNGKEALDHIEREGDPNLILLDVNMPVMNGLEFLAELATRRGRGRIPVIIVSTEGKEHDILRGLEAGARAYLRKPFTAEEL